MFLRVRTPGNVEGSEGEDLSCQRGDVPTTLYSLWVERGVEIGFKIFQLHELVSIDCAV